MPNGCSAYFHMVEVSSLAVKLHVRFIRCSLAFQNVSSLMGNAYI